jgi:ribulose-5-phosphate 4-epimerase/fuculose-1-phosphate aldolase
MTDGIIKYNFHFTKSAPLDENLWREIEDVRERLYALKLIGEKEDIGYGNISLRTSMESFVITGTQTGHLPHLTAQHYSLVKKWDDERFTLHSSGAAKPSSEALTHGTIYNLSPDIQAVIHIHSLKLWDFMLANSYTKTANVPYGSREMIQAVQSIYENSDPLTKPAFVMHGHREGIITFGKNLIEAEKRLYEIIGTFLEH